jgi:hypothetical protein
MRTRRGNRGQRADALKVGGAVPRTALIPIVNWHYGPGRWNFAPLSPEIKAPDSGYGFSRNAVAIHAAGRPSTARDDAGAALESHHLKNQRFCRSLDFLFLLVISSPSLFRTLLCFSLPAIFCTRPHHGLQPRRPLHSSK